MIQKRSRAIETEREVNKRFEGQICADERDVEIGEAKSIENIEGSGPKIGLKDYSRMILSIIEEKSEVSYCELESEMKKRIKCQGKSTGRRIYDALHVFQAIGLIDKKDKRYIWRGESMYDQKDQIPISDLEVDRLSQEIAESKGRSKLLEKLINTNLKGKKCKNREKVKIPLMVVKFGKGYIPTAKIERASSSIVLSIGGAYEILRDVDIISKYVGQ